MNVIAIIQARCGSTRFPNKVFADLAGKPLIWHVINRLHFAKEINQIVLATTINPQDDLLVEWAAKESVNIFRGSEENVLSRFYHAAKEYNADVIVRITADDPFKDPALIDSLIRELKKNDLDFIYNNNPPSFPEGLDCEIMKFSALEKAYNESVDKFEQEHVTQYLYRHKELFTQKNISNESDLSNLRWTIDTQEDYEMAKIIYDKLFTEDTIFHTNDILNLINKHPKIAQINSSVSRSAMYKNK